MRVESTDCIYEEASQDCVEQTRLWFVRILILKFGAIYFLKVTFVSNERALRRDLLNRTYQQREKNLNLVEVTMGRHLGKRQHAGVLAYRECSKRCEHMGISCDRLLALFWLASTR